MQITGDLATGDVYIAGMDEGGGGLTNRANQIYRSTDGGNTWANTYTGPTFPAPAVALRAISPACTQPRLLATHGLGSACGLQRRRSLRLCRPQHRPGDPGNVFYIRSTDGGVTFSAPFMLNTNTDPTKAQWQPNLSVTRWQPFRRVV